MKGQIFLLSILSTIALAFSSAAEPIPVSSLNLDYSKLKSWGTRKYRIVKTVPQPDGKKKKILSGTTTMITKVSDKGITMLERRPVSDEMYDYILFCDQKPLLPVKKMTLKIWLKNKLATKGLFLFNNGKATGDVGGHPASFPMPADTVTHASLLRIIALLPRKQNAEYTFSRYSIMYELTVAEAPKKHPFKITCLKTVRVAANKKRPDVTALWTIYRVEIGEKDIYVYVDKNHIIQRIKLRRDTILDLIR